MAVLTETQKTNIFRSFVSQLSQIAVIRWTKPELKLAASVINDWLDSNLASLNTALTVNASAFASTATNQQKALLLVYVVLVRAGILSASLE